MNISREFRQLLEHANSICVLTGAGISAESGIPTFRATDGLWARFHPEELASIEGFLKNPELVSAWYAERRRVLHHATPNPAHRALASMAHFIPEFTLITQNVDNLHARAGSRDVLELHGNIERDRCFDCGRIQSVADGTDEPTVRGCAVCGGILRPDVVWFGEMLPPKIFQRAEEAATRAELFLVVGTSAVVYPAASLPLTARSAGAFLVEINPEPTDLSHHVDEIIRGKAADVLPTLKGIVADNRVMAR